MDDEKDKEEQLQQGKKVHIEGYHGNVGIINQTEDDDEDIVSEAKELYKFLKEYYPDR